jgi:hypothetical protein
MVEQQRKNIPLIGADSTDPMAGIEFISIDQR